MTVFDTVIMLLKTLDTFLEQTLPYPVYYFFFFKGMIVETILLLILIIFIWSLRKK